MAVARRSVRQRQRPRAVERLRCDVGRQERDLVDAQLERLDGDLAQRAEVVAVDGGARADHQRRRERAQAAHAGADDVQAVDAADRAVELGRVAVERHGDVDETLRDRGRELFQRQAAREQVQREAALAEEVGDVHHVGAQQRLAAGEHDRARAVVRQPVGERRDLAQRQIVGAVGAPPVARHAARVASRRRGEQHQRQHVGLTAPFTELDQQIRADVGGREQRPRC